MSFIRELSQKNIRRRPARTAALLVLSAFLTFALFAGTVVLTSLQNGLRSYEARLGADIVAVPTAARSKGVFESILLQGIPGMFYMNTQDAEKIASIEGVETAAPQFYLASTSAGCCSVAVQIIGFDPDLDFTVQPWIREQYADRLQTGDIIVGCELTVPKDKSITFFNTPCRVVAQLDRTGTGLDTAVYANMDTIQGLIESAQSLGFHQFDEVDPDHAVSSMMIKVADGYDVEEVTGDINVHVRHIEAAQSASMLSEIAGGLSHVSTIIRLLLLIIWILAVVVLAVAFILLAQERAKEFAVLRMLGASRSMVSGQILTESLWIGLAGSAIGLLASLVLLIPFRNRISALLELPFLLPAGGRLAVFAVLAVALSILAGALPAAWVVHRISRQDVAAHLQEGI